MFLKSSQVQVPNQLQKHKELEKKKKAILSQTKEQVHLLFLHPKL